MRLRRGYPEIAAAAYAVETKPESAPDWFLEAHDQHFSGAGDGRIDPGSVAGRAGLGGGAAGGEGRTGLMPADLHMGKTTIAG